MFSSSRWRPEPNSLPIRPQDAHEKKLILLVFDAVLPVMTDIDIDAPHTCRSRPDSD